MLPPSWLSRHGGPGDLHHFRGRQRNELVDLIEPQFHRTSSKDGRPPYPLETILRIHLLQQWYDLSDPSMENAMIEVETMRRLAGISLVTDRLASRSVPS